LGRHPGTSKYDRLRSSAGGAPGQGGRAPANIQRSSVRDAAVITAEPNVKKVEIEKFKAPSEVAKNVSETGENVQKEKNLKIINKHQDNLSSYTARLIQARGDAKFSEKYHLDQKTQESMKRELNLMQQNKLLKANTTIQNALAEWAELLAAGKVGAPLLGVLTTLGFALGRLTRHSKALNNLDKSAKKSAEKQKSIINQVEENVRKPISKKEFKKSKKQWQQWREKVKKSIRNQSR
jgi:hypothetical protein